MYKLFKIRNYFFTNILFGNVLGDTAYNFNCLDFFIIFKVVCISILRLFLK